MVAVARLTASTASYVTPLLPIAPANNPRIAMYSARMPDVAAPRAHRAAAARTDTSSAPGGRTAQVGPAAAAVAPAIVAAPPVSELAAAARMAGSMFINMLSPD